MIAKSQMINLHPTISIKQITLLMKSAKAKKDNDQTLFNPQVGIPGIQFTSA